MNPPLPDLGVSGAGSPILVVEDEEPMRRVLRQLLASEGYDVLTAGTGEGAILLALARKPALVLLDLGLPDMDGLEVAQRIRECSVVPIVVLSVRSEEHDIVDALDRGANDYLTKPFREKELFARVRAALRSAALREPQSQLGTDDIRLDPMHRRVLLDGREVKLSATEFKLLAVIVRAAGTVVTHRQLLQEVWGPSYLKEVGYLRVYMHHLREKLELNPARPEWLLTEAGIGYRLGH